MPAVNMNGTSRADLIGQYTAALLAVQSALETLRAAAPHGRDYQTYPEPSAWRRANDAHIARCVALNNVASELESICEHLLGF